VSASGSLRDALQGGGQGAGAGGAAPWLDDVPHEVHAARHGLQDGLAGVELQVQAGQVLLDGGAGGVEPLRAVVQQDEVVHIAHVVRRAQAVFDELVQVIEQHVGKELAAQIADG